MNLISIQITYFIIKKRVISFYFVFYFILSFRGEKIIKINVKKSSKKSKTSYDKLRDSSKKKNDQIIINESEDINKIQNWLNNAIAKINNRNIGNTMFNYKLPLNGNDVMEVLNISGGPIIKKIMNDLMNIAFINPDITKDDCIKYVKEHYSK